MNSWLLSIRWPDFSATDRAIDTASVSARSATIVAGKIVAWMAPGDRSGSENGGSEADSAPTVRMPVSSAGTR